jgi:hypothetical protein
VGAFSSPALTGGTIYVGNDGQHRSSLHAIDPATGAVKWKFTVPNQIFSTPAVRDGVVYFHSRDDHVYAALYGPGLEPVVDGVPYPDLPAFAQRMLAPERSNRPTDPWGRLAAISESNRDVAVPVTGLLTLPVEVRCRPDAPSRPADRGAIPVLRASDREQEDG